MKFIKTIIFFFLFVFCFGCSSSTMPNENLIKKYKENNRIERYYELKDKYDDSTLILMLNSEEDHYILNIVIYAFLYILPDLPDVCATGGIIAIFYFAAWWLGVTLTGGGILAVLAWLGGLCGGIPGIPPAILGIIFLGMMFSILTNIFSIIF